MDRKQIGHTLLLVLAALIWGFAFVSQSIGADYVPPFAFCAMRSVLAALFLVPVIAVSKKIRQLHGKADGAPKTKEAKKAYAVGGGICGAALFAASALQQIGIAYTTTAKAGFITTLYVVFVPVVSLLFGHVPAKKIWFSVILGVTGLYFLCAAGNGGIRNVGYGDLLMLACAFMFCVQILCVNHFVQYIDGIYLSFLEMVTETVIAAVFALIFEHPSMDGIRTALPAILYAGIMSSGVAYTLQIVGQKDLDPTVASLAMCLESVFSAVGGWLLLKENLTGIEFFGCALMFTAIVISQLPERRKKAAGR